MTEEPYRWLEAISNRREYVREQLKSASPVFAASLPEGILLLGVGGGQSKVFELFDRQALAGLGHPADLEKIRQAAIDAAHLEAFNRAPEDVSLRRLVSFGLSSQLKTNFEQIYSAPFLIEMILAEVALEPAQDLLLRLHFDGAFQLQNAGIMVAASVPEVEASARTWLEKTLTTENSTPSAVAEDLLEAWWMLETKRSFAEPPPGEERRAGWRSTLNGRTVEIGWLARQSARAARYVPRSLADLGL